VNHTKFSRYYREFGIQIYRWADEDGTEVHVDLGYWWGRIEFRIF
jgi:hypothetical protein